MRNLSGLLLLLLLSSLAFGQTGGVTAIFPARVPLCATASLTNPQLQVVIGNNGAFSGTTIRCLTLLKGLNVDLVNNTIGPAAPTTSPSPVYRPAIDIFSIATLTVITRPDGTIHLGYQTVNTPAPNTPMSLVWWNELSNGTITDLFQPRPIKSDGTKPVDITLVRAPVAGDMIAVIYSTLEP